MNEMCSDLASKFGIDSYINPRIGRDCIISNIPSFPFKIRIQYCNSLGFKSPQLFNILLSNLRELYGVDVEVFPERLDKFLLSEIPVESTLCCRRRKEE